MTISGYCKSGVNPFPSARATRFIAPFAPGTASALNGLATKLFSVKKKICTPVITTPTYGINSPFLFRYVMSTEKTYTDRRKLQKSNDPSCPDQSAAILYNVERSRLLCE